MIMWKKYISKIILVFLASAIILSVFYFFKTNSDRKLKNEIGQMIMIGFRGTGAEPGSYITRVLREVKVGGVILFDYDVPSNSYDRNIVNPEQLEKLISNLKSYSSEPLLVAVDAEGGKVNRLKEKYGFLPILSPKEMGEAGNTASTTEEALKLAFELKTVGFNMNMAPVVDVDVNPDNPVIGALGRSFSPDPQQVFLDASAFIEVHKENNIITVAKHFPGHGSSQDDSHLGLVDVTETYKKEELIPYQKLREAGMLQAVMTAHIIDRNIDENYPATLSPRFLQDILRGGIGFEGVIISDDMQMGAITSNYGFEESIIMAVNAGCDILILSNNGSAGYDENVPYKVRDVIYEAVKTGKISRERITESYERISLLKSNLE